MNSRLAFHPIAKRPDENRRQAERRAVLAALKSLGIDEPLEHTASGAPFLPGHPDVAVSVSHSQTTAVVAISYEGSIGIDLEGPRKQLERAVPRILSADELAAAKTLPDGLLRAWTAKEAVFKAALTPGVNFTDDIVLLPPDFTTAVFKPQNRRFGVAYTPQNNGELLAVATADCCNTIFSP